MLKYNPNLKYFSRELRKKMTDAESALWSRLRMKQLKNAQFYRQKIIGNFIVDFYCPTARLIVELDGGQHYTNDGILKDRIRDWNLKRLGFRVLRFSDNEMLTQIDGVVEEIYKYL